MSSQYAVQLGFSEKTKSEMARKAKAMVRFEYWLHIAFVGIVFLVILFFLL